MNDFFKSLKSVLNERISSPFYGTLIVSWLLWNWKIPYVTFFISETKLNETKIDYIINSVDFYNSILFPLISTIVIITLIPFITNGAFWISTKFDIWRKNQSNKLYKKQPLSIEESLSLRSEMDEMENKINRLISKKDLEVKQKDIIISEANNTIEEKNKEIKDMDSLIKNNDKSVIDKDNELIAINKKTESLEKELSEINIQKNKLRIIYATYGADGEFNDVTDVVSKLLDSDESFNVENNIMGGDVILFSVKDLFIIYEVNFEIKRINAIENSTIKLENDSIVVLENDKSKISKQYLDNQIKLSEIFEGEWTLTYQKNVVTGTEKVKFYNTGKLFVDGFYKYKLLVLSILNNQIKLNKIDSNRKVYSLENLTIVNEKLITGKDNHGFVLEYKKNDFSNSQKVFSNQPIIIKEKEKYPLTSDLLKNKVGSFSVWIKVPSTNVLLKTTKNNRYIIGHDTNNGNRNPKNNKYINAFGLCLTPNPYNTPKSVSWRLWLTNNNGKLIENKTKDWEINVSEWHLFVLRWDHDNNILNFSINGELEFEMKDYINFWPQSFIDSLYIGNWVNLSLMHHLNMPLFRMLATNAYLDDNWVQNELNNKLNS